MENSDDVQFVENLLKQQGTKFTDFMRQTFGMTSVHANPVAQNSLTAISNNSTNVRTGEIMTKLFATLATLAVSGTVTFFIMKWLLKHLDPTNKEKEEQQKRAEKLLKVIGVCDSKLKLTEYELCVAANLVDPLSFTTDWTDIGGLDDIAKELQETVILPFKRQKLFEVSKLLQAPKGVLLYGPPGCGKTMLAKATARAAGARFINLQVSSLVDKWYGESQKRAEAVFSLAIKLQPTIIFIDELDTFLRNRSSGDHEATAMIKTQFMTWWDGIMTDDNCQIIVMGATNRPQDVDAAILRRMPSMFHVGLPTKSKRRNILEIILCGEDVDDEVDLGKLSADTQGYSGSDLKELCRNAAICRVREYLDTEKLKGNCSKNEQLLADADAQLRPMLMKDFEISIKRMRESKYTSVAASTEIEID